MPLDLTIRTAPLPVAPAPTVVIYAADGAAPAGAGGELWSATGLDWSAVREAAGFKGKQGNVLDILMPAGIDARRLLVLGSGKPGSSDAATAWTDRGGSLAGKLLGLRITEAAVVVDGDEATPERQDAAPKSGLARWREQLAIRHDAARLQADTGGAD